MLGLHVGQATKSPRHRLHLGIAPSAVSAALQLLLPDGCADLRAQYIKRNLWPDTEQTDVKQSC